MFPSCESAEVVIVRLKWVSSGLLVLCVDLRAGGLLQTEWPASR
jgi:hypothetical protein